MLANLLYLKVQTYVHIYSKYLCLEIWGSTIWTRHLSNIKNEWMGAHRNIHYLAHTSCNLQTRIDIRWVTSSLARNFETTRETSAFHRRPDPIFHAELIHSWIVAEPRRTEPSCHWALNNSPLSAFRGLFSPPGSRSAGGVDCSDCTARALGRTFVLGSYFTCRVSSEVSF